MKSLRKKSRSKGAVFYAEDYGFLGHLIYSERKNQGISKEKVALDLNLSTYIIENLETGHLKRPPGLSYMTGFLRTYADYLGLNPREIIHYVKPVNASVFEEETVLKVPFQQRQLPNPMIVWGSVFVLILLLIGYSSSLSKEDQNSPLNRVKLNELPTTQVSTDECVAASLQQFLNIYHKPFLTNTSEKKIF